MKRQRRLRLTSERWLATDGAVHQKHEQITLPGLQSIDKRKQQRQRGAKWYAKNKELAKARAKLRYAANREKIIAE